MELKDKYIVFDTNMWLKILNNNSNEINRTLLSELQKQNELGIYNMSIIEILMRFYRKDNLPKIKEFLEYIYKNDIHIGNIGCPNFYTNPEEIVELRTRTDKEIISTIEEYKKKRFEFKSTIIALWILILLELSCPFLADNKKHIDNIVVCCNNKANKIKDTFVEYFSSIENNNKKTKHLRDITNKIYKEILNEIVLENNFINNEKYVELNNTINELKPEQSISYILKDVYSSKLMIAYKNRIDKTLDYYYNSDSFKKIFYSRLEAFMQGECLQRNDVEDMLMLSVLEKDKNIVLVTDDNKMIEFLENNNYKLGIQVHDDLLKK